MAAEVAVPRAEPSHVEHRISEQGREALRAAVNRAAGAGHAEVGTPHMLVALLDTAEVGALLASTGFTAVGLREEAEALLARLPAPPDEPGGAGSGAPGTAPRMSVAVASEEAAGGEVSPVRLLAGLAAGDDPVGRLLRAMDLTRQRLLSGQAGREVIRSPYAQDLTLRAGEGRLDRIVGRAAESRRLVEILSRRDGGNALLVGERGAGKSALIAGLAHRVEAGEVPAALRGVRLVALDLAAMPDGELDRIMAAARRGGAIGLLDEAATRLQVDAEDAPEEVREAERAVTRLEIERFALLAEDDAASRARLAELDRRLADAQEGERALRARWYHARDDRDRSADLRRRAEDVRAEAERAQRDGDLETAARLLYGELPDLERRLAEAEERAAAAGAPDRAELREDDVARVVSDVPGASVTGGTGVPVQRAGAALGLADPRTLGGYRLLRRLGQGGQGVVYLAEDADGRRVAVKVLHAAALDHPRARERFFREIDAARRVASFCTAQVLDADIAGELPYVVSEYVTGPSLRRAVAEEGTRSGGALDRLAIGTITALAAIAEAGIVHRDFKPDNVLLGPDGPRVIDFGIARITDAGSSVTGQAIGTPAYMAPEQFEGGRVGPAADVYAWACTMVQAATGRPPHGADSIPQIMYRKLRGEADLGDFPARASATLRTLVGEGLRTAPGERPAARDVLLRLIGQDAPAPTRLLAEGAARATGGRWPRAARPRPRSRGSPRCRGGGGGPGRGWRGCGPGPCRGTGPCPCGRSRAGSGGTGRRG
ncbi:protein kinase [Actinomadura montaniterrae]|uniref:Protein kinase n=1 Tax=Actinomadura montaniterrae TaxID=1803903 RepID=A0A6L3VGN3_9ACTN|nr:protein kinase [Actinomadura montaniterrae]